MKSWKITALMTVLALMGCKRGPAPGQFDRSNSQKAIIAIDGSSTVYPITEAVAEGFKKINPTQVTIGVSGTGGGFKKFCKAETTISGASRPIKPTEAALCRAQHIDYIELPVAYDGIAVVVHKNASWVDKMTVRELKKLWAPEAQGQLTRWNQLRTGWPDQEIHLFGPGVDSGTYDYFTEAIVGKEHSSRGDLTSSEDDNVLVQGVATDPLALGFFGISYLTANADKLKAVPIDDENAKNGDGAILPSPTTVANGTYQPLSRPLFLYINRQATERKEVRAFIAYYLGVGRQFVKEVGYVPLPEKAYELVQKRFAGRVPGSVFSGAGSKIGVTVEQLLAKEQ